MSQMINMIGKHFGRWTVLELAEKKNKKIYWHCRCECGNEKNVEGYVLRSGQSKSCGCLHKEIVSEIGKQQVKIIPKGTRFGRLIVIERSNNNQYGRVMWKCQCDCGNICEVRSVDLIRGETQSCGCLKKELISERHIKIIPKETKFGKLTVLQLLDERQNEETVYQCKCECGSIVNIKRSNLISGNTQSCGCIRSKGEFKIAQILTENNISFEKEKSFNDCKFEDTNALAKFDFYVDNKYIIEFDGIQHFQIHGWNTEENFQKIQEYDVIKNQYCKDNNIPLIRIPYTHYNDLCLEDLILEASKFLVE